MATASDVVRSRSNSLVRRVRALKERGAADLCLVEGMTLLDEALSAGIVIVEVAATPRVARSDRGRRLLRSIEDQGIPVRLVDESILSSLSELETSQGVLALGRRPTFAEDRLFAGNPLVVVAAGLQNPGNVGGLLRTAEAAGATGAILTEGTADPLSWKALRGSMGSAFRLPHLRSVPLRSALERLRSRGVRLVATVAAPDATSWDRADLTQPVALLFGSEGSGLSEDIVAQADLRVTIPLAGAVESLNVGVAAGILLFEAARQRRSSRSGFA